MTEQVLAAAKGAMEQVEQASAIAGAPDTGPGGGVLSDPLALGVQIASLLGQSPAALLEAWRAAAAGSPGLAPSDSLALAERTLRARGASST